MVIFLAKVKILEQQENVKFAQYLQIELIFKNVKDIFACDEQILTSRGPVK